MKKNDPVYVRSTITQVDEGDYLVWIKYMGCAWVEEDYLLRRSENPREELLELLRTKAYEEKEVILASGKKSNFFIDCKKVTFTAEGQALAGEVLLEAIEEADAVAAVPLGACPLASAVGVASYQRDRPLNLLYIRPKKKDHGTGQKVEGSQNMNGGRVVLLEDVVTTGGSCLPAIKALREEGFEVVYVLTLVDRQEGGQETLKQEGVELRSIYTVRDFTS